MSDPTAQPPQRRRRRPANAPTPETSFVTAIVPTPEAPRHANFDERWPPAPGEQEESSEPRAGVNRQRSRSSSAGAAFPYIALLLAIALLWIGYGSYIAASRLSAAVHAAEIAGVETPDALAATVCNDLIHQNYGDLVSHIDHNPAPPAATGTFDSVVATEHLKAQDRNNNPVTTCDIKALSASDIDASGSGDGATRLLLVMTRAGDTLPISAVLITKKDADGAWQIERDSSFLLAQ